MQTIASRHRCPDSTHMEPPLHGPLYVVGCGAEFDAEPDREGLIDCPNCGMWFDAPKRYIAAMVVPLSVQDGESPNAAWERFATEHAGAFDALFVSGPLQVREADIEDPDFDVEVRSGHGPVGHVDPFDAADDELGE